MAKTIKIKVETIDLLYVYRDKETGALHTGTYPWCITEDSYESAVRYIHEINEPECEVKKIFKGEKRVDVYEIPVSEVILYLNIAKLDFSKYRLND